MVVGPREQKEGGLNENSKQSRPEEEDVVIADKQVLSQSCSALCLYEPRTVHGWCQFHLINSNSIQFNQFN